MNLLYPQRLNLAIANECFVRCPGCYQHFGKDKPDLLLVKEIIGHFLELGIDKITLSGGDPLTIPNILPFLYKIRSMGVEEIKVDTVGTSFLTNTQDPEQLQIAIPTITNWIEAVDLLGIPMDGWDNESVLVFRKGRKNLFNELHLLLNSIESLFNFKKIVINTVLHAGNLDKLYLIYGVLQKFKCISEWHIFQYSPTDNVPERINTFYKIDNKSFYNAKKVFFQKINTQEDYFKICFYSVYDRLGQYLLINSDGNAWLPDQNGKTIQLGKIYNNEENILKNWNKAITQLGIHHMESVSMPGI